MAIHAISRRDCLQSFAAAGLSLAGAPLLSSSRAAEERHGDWESRLYTPTYIARVGEYCFIVDCWHLRVLYARGLHRDIRKWKVLDNNLAGPHSIASDGELYVVEDTGRHAICAYRHHGNRWERVDRIEKVGLRPHRTRYDHQRRAFYVVSSNSQTWTKLSRRRDGRLEKTHHQRLPFLKNAYTRSFTPHDGELFFVSGPQQITVARQHGEEVRAKHAYHVPKELGSMNDIYFGPSGWIYLTATPGVILRTRSLEKFERGEFENVTKPLGLRGTPYYLSEIAGRLIVPEITEYSGAIAFRPDGDKFAERETLFNFGPPTEADKRRKSELPM